MWVDGDQALIFKAVSCPATLGQRSVDTCTVVSRFLRKISKASVSRHHILKLKNTKFDFHWDPPKTTMGSLRHSLRVPREAYFQGEEGKWEGRRDYGRGKEGRVVPFYLGTLDPVMEEGRGEKEGQRGELGLGRPGTSFFHFKHCCVSSLVDWGWG